MFKLKQAAPGELACLLTLFSPVLIVPALIFMLAAGLDRSESDSTPIHAGTQIRLRLITSEQYKNTIEYLFGDDLKIEPQFAPLRRTEGLLANGAAVAGVTASQMEQYQRTASLISARVMEPERRAWLMPCEPESDSRADRKCAEAFLKTVGSYLYRRSMTAAELEFSVKAATEGAELLHDFYAGIGVALEGMLLDSGVIFITEFSEPDPDSPGEMRLDAYSLASRLSFFLWNAAPDERVLEAARTGEIQTDKGRRDIVEYMLESPRIKDGVRNFFSDMLHFDDFNTLAKDATVYPLFTGVTAADAREETLRTIVDHLIVSHGDYRDLLTSRKFFISPSLALLYGLPSLKDWSPYTFEANSPRMGLLTQVSFLAAHAHPGRSSPTLRGKALREVLLCQSVPPPPPNVDFSVLEDPASAYPTQRDRVQAHLKDPVCAGCHAVTDPIGLALENFDGSGVFRETENGAKIDSRGSLDGTSFDDAQGLALALHDHPELPRCLVRRTYSYAIGGAATQQDKTMLAYLNERFEANGYRFTDLLREIALSKAFAAVAND